MAKDDRIKHGILGDIKPIPDKQTHNEPAESEQDIQSMEGGSRHDRAKHSGSRDVTEGATGGGIGNRPE